MQEKIVHSKKEEQRTRDNGGCFYILDSLVNLGNDRGRGIYILDSRFYGNDRYL